MRRKNPVVKIDSGYGPVAADWDPENSTLKHRPMSEWDMSQRVKSVGGVRISKDHRVVTFDDGESWTWDPRFNWWAKSKAGRKSNPYAPSEKLPKRIREKRTNDLSVEAMEGYSSAPLNYIYSSPSWYAYKIGEFFRITGRPEPSDVRMGRGYQIHVRDMTFSFGKNDAITRVK